MAIIGIDLGTTNSLACVFRNGKPELIPNVHGNVLTPSCVGFDDSEKTMLVGAAAKERLVSHPLLTAGSFKRYMGTDKKIRLGSRNFTAPELSSFVIRRLKEDAEAYLREEVTEAVISVPAYFDDNGRNAVKAAGQLAGLKVERIVNEPSAAALAYANGMEDAASFLVFDFGGGTLDVSLVDAFDNIIEIVAVAGDNRLGGDDFDMAIAGAFCAENNIDPNSLRPEQRSILIKQAEACKRALSSAKFAVMMASLNGRECSMTLDNVKLANICAELFRRIETPVRRVLRDSGRRVNELDCVIMVGGASQMPVVRQFISKLTGLPLKNSLDPDRVVGIGAGCAAGIKSRSGEIRDTILCDICPFTLGTGIINRAEEHNPIFSPIIPRNTALPASRSGVYSTAHDNQKQMSFSIYQGESMYCRDNLELGKLEIDVPEGREGEQSCEFRLSYDINGILEADIRCLSTGKTASMLILNKNIKMSDKEIKDRREALEKLKLLPRDEDENKALLERANSLCMELTGGARNLVLRNSETFLTILGQQDSRAIRRAAKQFKAFLDAVERAEEAFDPFADGFEYDEDDDE